MYKPKILVVEDDPAITNLMRTTLDTQEYQYHTARTGSGALLDAVSYNPDVIILDLGLPDMDGVDIIRKIRGWSEMPIIVVSARSEDQDKVEALDAGADDYLTKPFSIDELLARLRAALRRSRADYGTAQQNTAVYHNGSLTIDYAAGCVYLDGEEIHLTPIEYKLLCVLAREYRQSAHPQLYSQGSLGQCPGFRYPFARVFMATLLQEIEKDPSAPRYIQTHIGVGYRMIRQ